MTKKIVSKASIGLPEIHWFEQMNDNNESCWTSYKEGWFTREDVDECNCRHHKGYTYKVKKGHKPMPELCLANTNHSNGYFITRAQVEKVVNVLKLYGNKHNWIESVDEHDLHKYYEFLGKIWFPALDCLKEVFGITDKDNYLWPYATDEQSEAILEGS